MGRQGRASDENLKVRRCAMRKPSRSEKGRQWVEQSRQRPRRGRASSEESGRSAGVKGGTRKEMGNGERQNRSAHTRSGTGHERDWSTIVTGVGHCHISHQGCCRRSAAPHGSRTTQGCYCCCHCRPGCGACSGVGAGGGESEPCRTDCCAACWSGVGSEAAVPLGCTACCCCGC